MKSVAAGWFEIPTQNMERAVKFYESVFEVKLELQDFGELQMAWFPWDHQGLGAGGSLVYQPEHYQPGQTGTLVYFACDDLSHELSRIERAGGEVLQPKTEIAPDIGFMALFLDTEGNRLALHSKH